MADVFISYAREDRDLAARLAAALEARGHSVWWDRYIQVGHTFDEVIERELDGARCVIVLWSAASIASEWVRNEAAHALERQVLLPVRIADVRPPLEFRRRQTVDLIGWRGDGDDPGFLAVAAAIDGLMGVAASPAGREQAKPRNDRSGLPKTAIWGVLGVVVLGAVLSASLGHKEVPPPEAPPAAVPTPEAAPAPAPASTSGSEPTPDKPVTVAEDLADKIAGRYAGDIIAASAGSSRSGVTVTVSRIDAEHVRVTGSDARMKPVELSISRLSSGSNHVYGDGGSLPTVFAIDLGKWPYSLSFNPDGTVAFEGRKLP